MKGEITAGVALVGKGAVVPRLRRSKQQGAAFVVRVACSADEAARIESEPPPNCDGLPKNNRSYALEVGDQYCPLRCCGP